MTFGQVAECTETPLPARDVADDLLAANRIAAPRPEDQHIVGAAHLDLLLAAAERAADDRRDRSLRLFSRRRSGGTSLPRNCLGESVP